MTTLKRTLTAGLLSLALHAPAQAAHYALEDWWLTTDAFGGLKQSEYDPTFHFAVSAFTTWAPADTYEIPTGFRWATTQDILDAFTDTHVGNWNYYNQGGWSGYIWEGQARHHFRALDSGSTYHYLHAGQRSSYQGGISSSTAGFAGLVLIEDMSEVPVPAALGLMLAALGGLGLAGWRRRNA